MPAAKIKRRASELGFTETAIARVNLLDREWNFFNEWLRMGYHAGMKYMENYLEIRKNPALLLENARSIIIVLLNYYTTDTLLTGFHYKIAKYAYGEDYHLVMKQKLNVLSDYVISLFPDHSIRPFSDTAPIMEKVWAQKCGLGWIGKNTCLLNQKYGSFFFIGGLITDIDLPADDPVNNRCGNCRKCLDACPTGALVQPYVLDAAKCISYLTIEHKGAFSEDKMVQTENYIFGCDICQDVCPWNRFAIQHSVPELLMNNNIKSLTKEDLENMTQDEFERIFKKSSISRTRYNGLMRNVKVIKEKNSL